MQVTGAAAVSEDQDGKVSIVFFFQLNCITYCNQWVRYFKLTG